MLTLEVTVDEGFDETAQQFVATEVHELELEHSLFSLAKWESREEKSFLSKDSKTTDEVLRYIKDMLVTPGVSNDVLSRLSKDNLEAVNAYINAKMTATTFRELEDQRRPLRSEIVTAEVMYHWMVSLQIPFDPCEHWHLNRLITLVKVCNEKNKPAGKKQRMTRSIAAQRAEMNRQRQAQYGTTG